MKNLSPFTGRFSLVKKRTQDVVREDFGEDEIDFVLLDADHTYEGMKADLQKFYPMLRMNGYIFVKDYNATAVMNAVKDFRNENKLRMEMNLTNGFTAFWSKQ
jgi:cephalosporin hydroxylase